VDRIVGDLASVVNFGVAASTTQIDLNASASNTDGKTWRATIFAGNTSLVGNLTSGEYFYLLSLQSNMTQVGQWSGSAIQPTNNLFYNNYGNAFIADTDAYTYAYSDRLSTLSPDLFYHAGTELAAGGQRVS